MLQIRVEQQRALEQVQHAAFMGRVQRFIESKLKRPVEKSELDVLFVRGRSYGLQSEQDFARYMFIATAANARSTPSDPDWIRQTMTDTAEISVVNKLERLFQRAEDHLPRDVFRGSMR